MLSEEEKKAIEDLNSFKSISILYGNTFRMFLEQLKKYQQATETILNLISRLQKENKDLQREKEENKFIIAMANNEMLGYNQGYSDAKNQNSNATEIIMKNRQDYIHKEEIKLYKIKIEILKEENTKKDKKIKTLEHTNKTYKGIINKQNKQIDLMAEELSNIDFDKMCEECHCAVGYGCNADEDIDLYMNCIKRYFEKLTKEKGE